jgi:hypothetical protein
MAYNPFNIFRRNQRAIFSVVTVFIMFTFVLSSGLGGGNDFFDWFPRWFGAKTKKGDQLCTIDGTRIYSQDVAQVRARRVMASRFMELALQQALSSLSTTLRDQRAQATPLIAEQLQQALANPQEFARMSQRILDNPQSKSADKELVRTTALALELSRGSLSGGQIAAVANRTSRDVIEFMLWEKKADQLGIQFTDGDVDLLIQREVLGRLNDPPIREALQRDIQGFTWEACQKALKAEFRVRTAQTVLLGPVSERTDRTLSALPVFTPPYELFDYYREKTSPTTYEVLAVPAANFVDQVPTPSDTDLQRLFTERKDYESAPMKEEPGFREPRKVKVGWVSVTGEEPYYRKLAEEELAKGPVAAALVLPGFGGWNAITIAPYAATDPALRREYQKTVEMHNFTVRNQWSGSSVGSRDLLDTSFLTPRTLAVTVGGGAGLAGGFGNVLSPVATAYGSTIVAERVARVKSGVPLVLGPIPGPGLLATAASGVAAYEAAKPQPLSFEAMRPELSKQALAAKARELAVADLTKFKDDVLKFTDGGKSKNKGPAKDAIAEFIKTRGVSTGESKTFESEWTISDDEGLAPLKKVLDKGAGFNPHGNQPVSFGQRFFYTPGTQFRPREPLSGTYKPEFYPERPPQSTALEKPDPWFLAWRTEEQQAKNVTFEEARPKVVAAWKRIQARDKAKAAAEEIATKIRSYDRGTPIDFIPYMRDLQYFLMAKTRDPKAQERVKLFKVDNVSPLQINNDITGMGQGGSARLFQLGASADLPYPTPEMSKMLVEDRTKPAKTVFVLPDQPKDTYYVFVVADRQEKVLKDFKDAATSSQAMNSILAQLPPQYRNQMMPPYQAVVNEYARESFFKARDSVIGLIKKEFDYQETEPQKKLLDDREKKGDD